MKLIPPLMLFVTAALTALLWFRAIPMTLSAIGTLGATGVVEVTSAGCDEQGICSVLWPDGRGTVERTLDAPGLFVPEDGSRIQVIENGGRLERAGWSRLADAALMTALALGLSGITLNWFRRVLNAAPIMPDDYGELEPMESVIARHRAQNTGTAAQNPPSMDTQAAREPPRGAHS